MAKHTYTLRVTDFSGSPFPGAVPRARIRPMRDASGPDGMLSSRDIPVTLDGAGRGTVQLVATVDTAPETRYRLVVDWLTTTQGGQEIAGWGSEWEFTAVAGGGDIKTMGDVPASAFFVGPPWPDPAPPGIYYDRSSGWLARKDIA